MLYTMACMQRACNWAVADASGHHAAACLTAQKTHLAESDRVQEAFPCIVCQRPDFRQHWSWQLTALKELDCVRARELVVMIWSTLVVSMHIETGQKHMFA